MLTLIKVCEYLQLMQSKADKDLDPWGDPANADLIKEFDDDLVSLNHKQLTAVASINDYTSEIVWTTLFNRRLYILMDELFTNDERSIPRINPI
jgi:hypothetical protein